ncbi:hypothetical protein AVEN_119418-1 [Araneus ventricosus]|uniref:Uncharacterized protein n=1 Tax=Araneus ventricosus TaxID=182803 RepID=A0A4Y2SEC0_ARAVE|nr:hypothetical protein AVEN_119418-1 [Araneus ventricosus]
MIQKDLLNRDRENAIRRNRNEETANLIKWRSWVTAVTKEPIPWARICNGETLLLRPDWCDALVWERAVHSLLESDAFDGAIC